MENEIKRGRLVTWKDDRGFGFIEPIEGDNNIFIHISAFKRLSRRPRLGDEICYRITYRKGKVRAIDAYIVRESRYVITDRTPKLVPPSLAIQKPGLILPALWGFFPLIGFPLIAVLQYVWRTGNLVPLVLYPLISCMTYGLYSEDKSRAKADRWRIPENTLHLFEAMGGWPGAFLAQHLLRHKNRKRSYQTVFWLIVGLHYLTWIGWLVFGEALFTR